MGNILQDIIMRKSNDKNSVLKENKLSVTGSEELFNIIHLRSYTSWSCILHIHIQQS